MDFDFLASLGGAGVPDHDIGLTRETIAADVEQFGQIISAKFDPVVNVLIKFCSGIPNLVGKGD